MDKVSIIGQGYVGLPLAMACANVGFRVVGVDKDEAKLQALAKGEAQLKNVDKNSLLKYLSQQLYTPTSEFNQISGSSVIVICVPTPLNKNNEPDLNVLFTAIKQICKYINAGTLLIIESTVATGTIRNDIVQIIKENCKVKIEDLLLAYSPERIDPDNPRWNLKNTPKLVSGLTYKASQKAIDFYNNFIDKVVYCNSIEIAETAKLLENSFRLINISFINELSIYCTKSGIDINEVINAASTKPYGFMPFYPSLGVGGHCIPVDPIYLTHAATKVGSSITMIESAAKINRQMPLYFVSRANERIGGLKGKRILILGIAYKPNVSDTRESAAEFLIKELRKLGANVYWHDEFVQHWEDEASVDISPNYDLAILATPHNYFDLTKLGDVPILNTRESL